MVKNYWNYKISIQPKEPWVEILIAQLSDRNFDSFQESKEGVEAYIPAGDSLAWIEDFITDFGKSNAVDLTFEKELIGLKNWNEEWEKSFPPVVVGDFCVIKSPSHDLKVDCEHELTIMPKMSFGTGHHPTTFLMVSGMQEIDFVNKKVLDMGSGTGVLGILACKLQAKDVLGIDIEDWAVENAKENAISNNCKMEFELGGKEKIPATEFDVILANINRNILLDQKDSYFKALKKGGTLLLSGFLLQDQVFLETEFGKVGFKKVNSYDKENWICLVLEKK